MTRLMIGWRRVLVFGGAVLFGVAGDLSAQAKVGVMCADKQGAIVVRAKCRSGETKLTLGVLANKAPQGDTGAAGATGLSGYEIVSASWTNESIPAGGKTFDTFCPAGKTTVGGGCYSASQLFFNYESRPFDSTPRAWRCGFSTRSSSGSATNNLRTYAICVNE